ncbi:TonB family protein [Acinetobacter sp.]|uniref:TonB family protein n=1 Tax=Acinetobacter sp. TaxID=472 RepID=UPI002649EB97|nr:TonB family protein [Acinetobacter sp.]MDN5510787.1 TonB family protein [Acinetobacter sp.]MDN5523888.1 TonB family protein [Acinetobacter sp.]
MKQILCFSLLLSLPFSAVYSAAPKAAKQLAVQKSAALPAHLTTRIQWTKFPRPNYKNEDLKDQNRSAIIRIYADETGSITKASVQESTGLAHLDNLLMNAVREAHVKPHIENDTATPLIGYQTFSLKLGQEDEDAEACPYQFESKNWQAQQQNRKTPFSYQTQPQLDIESELLNGHNRSVKFTFKVNKHGDVKKVKVKQGSGIYALDQQVVQAVSNSQVTVKRTANTLWLYKKSSFKDEIKFDLNHCE